jgi:hypothetical protein
MPQTVTGVVATVVVPARIVKITLDIVAGTIVDSLVSQLWAFARR